MCVLNARVSGLQFIWVSVFPGEKVTPRLRRVIRESEVGQVFFVSEIKMDSHVRCSFFPTSAANLKKMHSYPTIARPNSRWLPDSFQD